MINEPAIPISAFRLASFLFKSKIDDTRKSLKKLGMNFRIQSTIAEKHQSLVCDYATKLAKDSLSDCKKIISHFHDKLLKLAKDYESVTFVCTSVGDFHSLNVELLGYITKFNTDKSL